MRVPIQVALSWPQRWHLSSPPLDLVSRPLTFEPPDAARFPALALARQAGLRGGIYPAVLNAANEQAVAAFLAGRLPFLAIATVVETVLEGVRENPAVSQVEVVMAADAWARRQADAIILRRGGVT